jgi:hypothetical protein
MPYHRMGDSKYKALGIPNMMRELQVMAPGEIEAVRRAFADRGVECTISK